MMESIRPRLLTTLVCVILLTSACTRPPLPDTPTADVPVTTGNSSTLRIFNWDDYIDPAILTGFENQMGVKIEYETYGSSDEMLAAIQADPSRFDVVIATDFTVTTLRQSGLLSPLNFDQIPNFRNVDRAFISPAYDPGNRYSVPYLWGTQGIGYNIAATGREITSWADFFNPQFGGRVALLADSRSTLGIALLYLGYSPNSSNPLEIRAAQEFLQEHNDQVVVYASDDEGQDLLADGTVDLVYEYSGDICSLMAENPDIRYAIPAEGTFLWVDNLIIPAGSANQELAEAFINYIYDPQVGALLANYTQYGSPNQAAMTFINETDRNNPAIYPSDETRKQLFYLVGVSSQASREYEQVWTALMGSR